MIQFFPTLHKFRQKRLLTLLFLGAGICFFLYLRIQSDAVGKMTQDTLSLRSQEFITQQKKQDGSSWINEYVETASSSAQVAGTSFSTTCFSFSLPYKVKNVQTTQTDQSCTFAARVTSPVARLVIWSRPLSGKFDEDSGIVLRRREKSIFSETEMISRKFGQVVSFRSKDQVILFAHSDQTILSFAFTDLSASRIKDEDLIEMLNSTMMVVK